MVSIRQMTRMVLFCTMVFCSIFQISYGAELIKLTDDTIEGKLEEDGTWFIKFYTPWCKHCKVLNPIFRELANVTTAEEVKVATVDCTKHSKATRSFNITSYPTIIFKRGDLSGRYEGPRTLEAFLTFIERMNAPAYDQVHRVSDLKTHSATDNVTFVLSVASFAEQNEEDSQLPLVSPMVTYKNTVAKFAHVAEKLKQHAAFAIVDMNTKEAIDSAPTELTSMGDISLVKFDNGKPVIMMSGLLSSSEQEIETFVEMNNYPLINEFDNHNFKRLSHIKKIIVCAVVDPRKSESTAMVREAFSAAVRATLTPYQAADFIFGVLDGVRWRSFVRLYDCSVPAILVLDQDNELHQSFSLEDLAKVGGDADGLQAAVSSILLRVQHHTLSMEWNRSLPPSFLEKVDRRFRDYYPWSLLVIALPVILLFMAFQTPYPKEKQL